MQGYQHLVMLNKVEYFYLSISHECWISLKLCPNDKGLRTYNANLTKYVFSFENDN